MRPVHRVSPDLGRALELTEELWTTAHGYATLFLTGFYVTGRRLRGRGGTADGTPAGPCGPVRTLTFVSDDSGRKYVIPDDPADRPVRTRRAVRVIVVGPDDRVLLFEDSDPGIDGVTWWVTPGGGMDPGETERTRPRSVRWPRRPGTCWRRTSWSGRWPPATPCTATPTRCWSSRRRSTWCGSAAFEIDISAHTEEEQITLQGHRWWSRSEIEAGGAWIWPAQLLELWDRAAEPGPPPLELGRQEESTVPV